MTQVFISYSRKDLPFVEQLVADLKVVGFDVWYDVSGIGGGSRWRVEIENAVRNSQYAIVVLSPDSMASEWVEREFLFASNLKRKIIPLYYRRCELPLYYLNLNYIDVQGENYRKNFDEILRALKGRQASLKKAQTRSAIPPSRKDKKVNSMFAVFVGALVIGGIMISSYFLVKSLKSEIPTEIKQVMIVPNTITLVTPTETPSTDIVDNFGVQMVYISAGDFIMGSNNGDDDERLVHTVSVPSFYIDKYEVTNKLYRVCVDMGGCVKKENISSYTHVNYYGNSQFDDFPVIHVNWDQTKAYCSWRGALLPSEAQWEKAALGTTGYIYPWGNTIDGTYANYDGAFRRDTSRVGSYELGKSMYGVYDMVGNVWEWTSSLYMPYPYRVDERENPNTPGDRVVRGGSWYDHSAGLRSVDRYGDPTNDENDGLGFRCAREAYP